jgi:8-oxo-dGTP diphosphatase
VTAPSGMTPSSGDAILVVAAVIERDGMILITRRPRGAHLEGFWEFPGGKPEAGETPEAALIREVREELGVDYTPGGAIAEVDWQYPDKRVRITFFRGTIAGTPRPLEGQEMEWVRPAELDRYEFPPADAVLLERLRPR